jgi:hypothetical protein
MSVTLTYASSLAFPFTLHTSLSCPYTSTDSTLCPPSLRTLSISHPPGTADCSDSHSYLIPQSLSAAS